MVPVPEDTGLLCTLGLLDIINMSWYLTLLPLTRLEKILIFYFKNVFGDTFQNTLRENGLLQNLRFSIAFLMKMFLLWNFCVYLLRTLMPLNDLNEFLFHSLLISLTILISDSVSCFLSSLILDKLPTPFLFSQVLLKSGTTSHRNVRMRQDHKYILLNYFLFFLTFIHSFKL